MHPFRKGWSIPESGLSSAGFPMKNLPLQHLQSGLSILTGLRSFVAGAGQRPARPETSGQSTAVLVILSPTPGYPRQLLYLYNGMTRSCSPARQGFLPGCFCLIAGFVEPGENLEHALVREVKEETGISVKNIRYFGSEP